MRTMNRRRKAEKAVASGQWLVASPVSRAPSPESPASSPSPLTTSHWPLATNSPQSTTHYPLPTAPPRAFTLTELLVTITIMGILASLVLGAMHATREAGHEYATKATIAKLNNIIMERCESYMTRRVPVNLSTKTDDSRQTPLEVAQDRLYAIRDLIRMEMPDRLYDIVKPDLSGPTDPIVFTYSGRSLPRPALSQLYYNYWLSHPPGSSVPGKECAQAEMLYLLVSMSSPETMEQFNTSEIGDSDGNGWMEFVDGWGRPIFFLRYAPGFSSGVGLTPNPYTSMPSDVQTGNPTTDHDPFDARNVNIWDGTGMPHGFHLIPLIYSAGSDGKFDINIVGGHVYSGDPYSDMAIGAPLDYDGDGMNYFDNITNHHIEQR